GTTRALAAVESRPCVLGGRQCAIARGDRCGARGPGVRAPQELGRTLPGVSLDACVECTFPRLACRCELLECTFAACRSQDARVVGQRRAARRRDADYLGFAPPRSQTLHRQSATPRSARRSLSDAASPSPL